MAENINDDTLLFDCPAFKLVGLTREEFSKTYNEFVNCPRKYPINKALSKKVNAEERRNWIVENLDIDSAGKKRIMERELVMLTGKIVSQKLKKTDPYFNFELFRLDALSWQLPGEEKTDEYKEARLSLAIIYLYIGRYTMKKIMKSHEKIL